MSESSEIENELLAFLRREVFHAETAVDREADLIAMGFDSMSLVRLLLFVEKKFGVWISEEEIANAPVISIGALADLINRMRQSK